MAIFIVLIIVGVVVAIALPIGLVALVLAPAAEANSLGSFEANQAVFSEVGMQPEAIRLGRAIAATFPIETIGGYPGHPTTPPDHGSGQALDVMIPNSTSESGRRLGDQIAQWLMDLREDARIVYLQWRGKIWNYAGRKDIENTPKPPATWRTSTGSYAPQPVGSGLWTHAHMDHLHVAVDGPVPLGGQANVPQSDWKGRGFTTAPTAKPKFANVGYGGGGSGGKWLFPVQGAAIGSKAGWRHHPILGRTRCHAGSDIGAAWGTPIRAPANGRVTFRGVSGGYGNFTKVSHGGGVTSHYAHQSRFAVSTGQQVKRGQVIGYIGSTGLSTGPHLHFEIFVNGKPYDPAGWVSGDQRKRVCV